MLLGDDLAALAERIDEEPDLAALLGRLRDRTAPLRDGAVAIPHLKALLSRNGGICPDDGATLRFDPLSPTHHACPRCGKQWTGERHDRHWARSQHLWLAERAVDASLLAVLEQDAGAADAAVGLLQGYGKIYHALPNRDNVLGPSHLFFSTYLESMWLVSYLTAAQVLREGGGDLLPEECLESVNGVAEEAAGLIGAFNEGLSNRQTWHSAALAAIAAWFGDEELAQTAIEERTGLLGHLADGFGEDGLWFEGENYHLFALRGLMLGLQWARIQGLDLLESSELGRHFRDALLAPAYTALPDFTYPARGDARYGSSLAQPAFLELWEIGRAWLAPDSELDAWLAALHARPTPAPEHYDAWLHDAGLTATAARTRRDLSWWALTEMRRAPMEAPAWQPASRLFAEQGLAVLRHGDRYASLECGSSRARGGHAHPDRLHLTLHADGVHWLADPGTGSYVHPSLEWYRSALAHNAPLLDGENAGGTATWCDAFQAGEEWSWARGRMTSGGGSGAEGRAQLRRTLVFGPDIVIDLVELDAKVARRLELPWHFPGGIEDAGQGESAETTFRVRAGDRTLVVHMLADGATFVRSQVPGPPGSPDRTLVLVGAEATAARWITVLDLASEHPDLAVKAVSLEGDWLQIDTPTGRTRLRVDATGLVVDHVGAGVALAGLRVGAAPREPLLREQPRYGWDAAARAPLVRTPPALDGSTDGFDCSEPLVLEGEEYYRPSEEPFDPEEFSARAWVNWGWDEEALYLAVEVIKSDLVLRPSGSPPLELDNEPDDIHADGLQLYLEHEDRDVVGVVISLEEGGGLRARGVAGTRGDEALVDGTWTRTDDGYRVTFRLRDPHLTGIAPGARLGFDLIVNEMRPGRQRRAGQLVWSGGDGWVYLRGDRQDPGHFGRLELD